MRPREPLTASQNRRLPEVRLTCPDITRVGDLACAFAGFLRQDRDTVTAGLTSELDF
ncbi:hypothetical protein [Streptomyces fagopyri]|uniref:hypothetical protein n=1 Tax=Streptomyces fagopyri TaxID=2662397 RepID=UPI00371847C0